MPIFEVRCRPQSDEFDAGAAMKRLCTTVAREVEFADHEVWASWHELPTDLPEQEPAAHDPVIRVISFDGVSDDRIERMLDTAARVVADALHVEPRTVCVTYEEAFAL